MLGVPVPAESSGGRGSFRNSNSLASSSACEKVLDCIATFVMGENTAGLAIHTAAALWAH